MRINNVKFCFAHLQSCHNGWACNILIVVDTGKAGIHHSKYCMPIHYDTIEDGQNKTSHCLFSFLVRIVLFFHFNSVIYLEKRLLHHSIPCHLHNNTPLKKKCFNPGSLFLPQCSSRCVL